MKRISRFALLTMFSLLLLGGTRAFAGSGDKGNNQGQNNQGGNSQGNNGGGLIGWIDNLLDDIFGDDGNQGGNNQGKNGNNGWSSGPGTTGGGGTAPIDGGISLLLVAG